MKNCRCLPYRPLTNEHAVLVGMSGVLDDGDDVGSLLRHVHEVSAGPVGELHCIHQTLLGGGEGWGGEGRGGEGRGGKGWGGEGRRGGGEGRRRESKTGQCL